MGSYLDDKIEHQISMIAHLLYNQYNEKLAKYDLTVAQARVLSLLNQYGTQMQLQLQQRLYIKASTMNGIIESLLNKNLIEKKENANDKRSKIISLSEEGKLLNKKVWDEIEKSEIDILKGFSEEESALLLFWLKKLKRNIIELPNGEEDI